MSQELTYLIQFRILTQTRKSQLFIYATVKHNPLLKMEYGKRLNPERSLRTPKGIKGTRQKVIVTHNPSEIDQNQELLVRFPNLGSDDVIIPGTANLSFNIELTSTVDANRTLVNNISRAIIKKLDVKFEGNEIMSVDDYDVLHAIEIYRKQSQKREMLSVKVLSLLMGAWKTALN